ncbi:mCG57341, isoform CRA_a, partial [Mus musculus]
STSPLHRITETMQKDQDQRALACMVLTAELTRLKLRLKKRTDSCKLPSDCHMCTHPHTHLEKTKL